MTQGGSMNPSSVKGSFGLASLQERCSRQSATDGSGSRALFLAMATSYSRQSGNSNTNHTAGNAAETFPTQTAQNAHDVTTSEKSTSKGASVYFGPEEKHADKRAKYFTAKYGAHQMSLVKKRLAVEDWIFEELGRLYQTENNDHDCDLDLEEVLNLDTDDERRQYVLEQLVTAKESQEEVHKFVEEVLKKARTL